MKTLSILLVFILSTTLVTKAQSLVGKWQLMKQTTCIEDEVNTKTTGVDDVLNDMEGMSGATPQILTFKAKNQAQESTRIISKRKTYNSKSFLYKYTGATLFFLDKKSQTIIESYTVEKMASDSLIISNAERECETKVFIKIK